MVCAVRQHRLFYILPSPISIGSSTGGLGHDYLSQAQNMIPYKHLLHGNGPSSANVIARRLLIGSTAPVCTYNECRGCKTQCKAEQVPVDANDPLNSAYHYRCVCHK
ncbi:EPIDERMAL PATTERNING FACTOR-like protein 9 isoform X2 [Cryptomeria japonica]|uniref:EPIDERMAL PATTERNING FACTOR-like protein 9 isoform X2 n=1 Tax=Cryptomeria japonica TaxID=3369 RepID=UPI0025AB7AD2|nr:EPIDERMAL PATTERNING FACTOR-like protein 9 isoform X2 [Cryptomeria japonica]